MKAFSRYFSNGWFWIGIERFSNCNKFFETDTGYKATYLKNLAANQQKEFHEKFVATHTNGVHATFRNDAVLHTVCIDGLSPKSNGQILNYSPRVPKKYVQKVRISHRFDPSHNKKLDPYSKH